MKIEATGTVTVNGSILASSAATPNYGTNTGVNDATAGAGGSIYITADSFKGVNGVLRADGGNSSCPTNYNVGRVGGGGCIAIKYNAASQQDGYVSGMTISAAPGKYKWKVSSKTYELGVRDDDKYRSEAGLGTLWFTDAKMLQSLGTGITGNILNISEYSADSLTISSGHFRFSADGFRLSISGNLAISGASSRLEIGGSIFTNRMGHADFYSATAPQITIGGNLSVSDGARLDIRAAATNETTSVGANVSVSGAFTIGADSIVYCWCDSKTGGYPRFEVQTLTIAEGGELTASGRGFAGGYTTVAGQNGSYISKGAGPGAGGVYTNPYASGGGHGGRAGNYDPTKSLQTERGGWPYDDQFMPTMPGSGGADASTWYTAFGGSGGGVVDVRALGNVSIAGSVTADGETGRMGYVGSGGGGTIYITGHSFTGAATGILSAKGGAVSIENNVTYNGAGGGGRISVWAGDPYDSTVKPSRIIRSSEAPTLEKMSFLGTVTAAGGATTQENTSTRTYTPGDGTVWFSYVQPEPGMTLIIQ